MSLVDDQQPARAEQIGQPGREGGIGQPFGRDEQHIDPTGPDVGQDRLPLFDVGGVDRRRLQSGARSRCDLVPHQGEQRGDHQGRSAAEFPQGRRRRPVDGRLAPPRRLDDEHAPAALDELVHRLGLVRPRLRLGSGHGRDDATERFFGSGARGGGHAPMLPVPADISRIDQRSCGYPRPQDSRARFQGLHAKFAEQIPVLRAGTGRRGGVGRSGTSRRRPRG